jgi:hypothetical protein
MNIPLNASIWVSSSFTWGHFPALLCVSPVCKETVGFIKNQNGILLPSHSEHVGNVFFRFTDVLVQYIRGPPDNERFADFICDVARQFAFPGACNTMEAECAMSASFESCNDPRNVNIGGGDKPVSAQKLSHSNISAHPFLHVSLYQLSISAISMSHAPSSGL